jgi:hypothetical protein
VAIAGPYLQYSVDNRCSHLPQWGVWEGNRSKTATSPIAYQLEIPTEASSKEALSTLAATTLPWRVSSLEESYEATAGPYPRHLVNYPWSHRPPWGVWEGNRSLAVTSPIASSGGAPSNQRVELAARTRRREDSLPES